MKISEQIEKLTKIKEDHGDLDCYSLCDIFGQLLQTDINGDIAFSEELDITIQYIFEPEDGDIYFFTEKDVISMKQDNTEDSFDEYKKICVNYIS